MAQMSNYNPQFYANLIIYPYHNLDARFDNFQKRGPRVFIHWAVISLVMISDEVLKSWNRKEQPLYRFKIWQPVSAYQISEQAEFLTQNLIVSRNHEILR